MAGFFKQWAENAKEYKALQNELKDLLALQGISFMRLHPEVTKFMVGVAREEGSEKAVARLNETIDMISTEHPNLSQEQVQKELVRFAKSVNSMASRS